MDMYIKEIMIEKLNSPKVVICCELCSYKSNRKSNFDRHMKSMHEECQHPFQCCGTIFINKASLKSHCRENHKNGYQCDQCNKLFPRKALLKRHQTVHNGIKEFSCPKCTYETSHKSNLERHCSRVHNLHIGNSKAKKKVCFQTLKSASKQSLKSWSNNSFSETDEFSSSQEMVSSQESLYRKFEPISIEDKRSDHSSVQLNNETQSQHLTNQNLIRSESMEDLSSKDEEFKSINKRLRLCLRPYKCLICWLLFESQLEYFEHQIFSDHTIEENSDELEVIRAAAVLTQLRRSSHQSLYKF